MKKWKGDRVFLGIVIALVGIGVIMFTSASLGILARNEDKFYNVLASQFIYGLGGGVIALYAGLRIPYTFWRKYALYFFILGIILTGLVFVPSLGMTHGGATRWVSIFGFSFQPVEFLKIGFIIYFSAWLSWFKGKFADARIGAIPLVVFVGISIAILVNQPDHKSMILIIVTGTCMLFMHGISTKHVLSILLVSAVLFSGLVFFTPYLRDRIQTFINPSQNGSTTAWQIQQSHIAIGSGGMFGRGVGQSIQKFSYLPEPQGDSIFAVIGEELGFVGSVLVVFLFVAFAFRGYRIALHAPDVFTKMFVAGCITIMTAQSFMNIASITGVFPLTGVPLVFISQGGTALLLSLGMIGIILNISSHTKKSTTGISA
jgi:cell division protein FtsW